MLVGYVRHFADSQGRFLKRVYLRRWGAWPLAVKLTLVMTVLVTSAVAVVSLIFIYREYLVARAEMQQQAELILSSVAVASSDALYFTDTSKLSDIARRLNQTPNVLFVRFYDQGGRLIGDSYNVAAVQRFEPDPMGQRLIQSESTTFDWYDDQLIAGQAIIIGPSPQGAISIGLSVAPLHARVEAIRYQGFGVAAAAASVGTLLALMVSRSITMPIKGLAAATHRIGRGEFDFKPKVQRHDEIGVLTRSFSDMTERLAHFRDGLEQRTAELSETAETLRRTTVSKNYVDNIMASLADTLIVVSPEGVIRTVNPAASALLGYSEDELIGRPLSTIFGDEELKNISFAQFMKEGPITNKELTYLSRDGTRTQMSFSGSVMQDASGQTEGIVCLAQDITERKRVQQALEEASQQALAASQAKSEFLASMSHEIRTPMNAIIGMANLLTNTPLTPDQQEYVRVFREAGDSLLILINDILDLSKVEAGRLSLEETPFGLDILIEDTAQIMAVSAHEKGLELCCRIAPDTPTQLVGDPVRLRQVLTNLLSNAIKFTARGEVLVQVEKDPDSQGPGSLLFRVSDTGIGVPADKLDCIFESFTQADSSTTREYGGSGLGLTISRRLVEMMGGRIWVESEAGRGSVFYFTARLGVQSEPGGPVAPSSAKLQGVRVLVLDDNRTSGRVLQEVLTAWGVRAEALADCDAGWAEMERASQENDPYRFVLLDRHLPGMEEFQAARSIQNAPGTTQPVVMLNANNQAQDVAHLGDIGIARYLVKPVRRSDLLRTITAVLDGTERSEQTTGASESNISADQRPLKILLVEDYKNNRLVIQAYLKKTPYQVDIAENGEIAVQKSLAVPYDLVLMDVQMPVMDGYTATSTIRQREAEQGLPPVPIIALTANATREDIQKSQATGFTAYLTKPINKAELLEAIYTYTNGVSV